MSKPIPIRFSDDDWAKLARCAQLADKPLSTYCRERLLSESDVDAKLAEILRHVTSRSEIDPMDIGAATDDVSYPILIEILLLLRQTTAPKNLRVAHGELERLGLSVMSTTFGGA